MNIDRKKSYTAEEIEGICGTCARIMREKKIASVKGELIIRALMDTVVEETRALEKSSGVTGWLKDMFGEHTVVDKWYDVAPALRALVCDRVSRLIIALGDMSDPLGNITEELVPMMKDLDDNFSEGDAKIIIDRCFKEDLMEMKFLRSLKLWDQWKKNTPEEYH